MLQRKVSGGTRLIPPEGMRLSIVQSTHEQHGHLAPTRLVSVLSQIYWWPSMKSDCVTIYSACDACTREKQTFKNSFPLKPCDRPTVAFEGWSLDLITNLNESHEGFKNLAVAVCCHSRWAELGPLRSKESAEVAAWFYNNIVVRYGKPKWVRVDAGGEFEGIFREMAKYLGIKLRVISPLNP